MKPFYQETESVAQALVNTPEVTVQNHPHPHPAGRFAGTTPPNLDWTVGRDGSIRKEDLNELSSTSEPTDLHLGWIVEPNRHFVSFHSFLLMKPFYHESESVARVPWS
jgi:hypothetical protein